MRLQPTIVYIITLAGVLSTPAVPASGDAAQQPRACVYFDEKGKQSAW
jgi:hypothetical protein